MSQPFDYPGPDPDREDLGSSRYTKKEVLFAGGDAEPDNGIYMYHVDNGFRRVGGTDLVSIDDNYWDEHTMVNVPESYMQHAFNCKVL